MGGSSVQLEPRHHFKQAHAVILHAKPSLDGKLKWTHCMEYVEWRSKT